MPKHAKRRGKGKGKGKAKGKPQEEVKKEDDDSVRSLQLENAIGGAWIGEFPNGKSYAFFSAFAPHLLGFAAVNDPWQMVEIDWEMPEFPENGTVRRAERQLCTWTNGPPN
jgi:hypothetical protein